MKFKLLFRRLTIAARNHIRRNAGACRSPEVWRLRLRYAAVALVGCASAARADDTLQYNRDIRPILAENCFACHGPDSAARKAGLRIDRRDDAVTAGAINPGNLAASELLRRIESADADEMMPPPASHKQLTPEQKQTLRRWVEAGAEYQSHWSLLPPVRPALPAVQSAAWVRNPIDAFVLAGLEKARLTPAPEADRRTLARRLSLDLTGLPPEPALVEAFVNDAAPDAYERFVDQLLASDAWGEHRGRYWLDYARYADTHGIHFDNYREQWAFRDWVIGAFNRNLPFDQFTIEQLAGDLLPQRTLDQVIASGFNRCNITTNEGGTIPEEYLVLYTRDRTETTSQVWLGTTMQCAVCHDHKFDPFSQKQFYELAAFFNNTTQAAMDGNIKDTPPTLVVPLASDRARWDALEGELAAARTAVDARRHSARPEFDSWLAAATPDVLGAALPQQSLHAALPLDEGQGTAIHTTIDGQPREVPLAATATWQPGVAGKHGLVCQGTAAELSDVGDFEKDQPFTISAWVHLPANDSAGALCARMEESNGYRGWDFWVQARRVGTHLVHRWPDDALKVVSEAQVPANEWTHITVSYDGSAKAAGVKIYFNGQPQKTLVEADALQNTIRNTIPFKLGQRHEGQPYSGGGLADLRIYRQALAPAEAESLARSAAFAAILAKPADQRTDSEKDSLYPWWLGAYDQPFQAATAQLAALEGEHATLKARGTVAHVMQEKDEAAMAYILFRGEYDKRRDPVNPDTPDALPPFPADAPRNRLGLAKWLLSPDNPLTARVTVNRFWQEVFGTGIVRTSGDFGVAGELPSNQELLDWLAVDFRENGWDVKRLFKLIVTSATYRQAAVTTPEKLEKDPQNRLLSRGPRFRMDAEMVRDYALAASGLLVHKLGGPSVRPYQPEGVWEAVAMIGSNTRDYRRDSGEGLYRRGLYTFWKRSAPPASLDIFNAPNRETCTVRRERTNTPLQALVTLNDEQYVEAAKHLAQRALLEGGSTPEERVDYLARRLLARPWRAEEQPVVLASLADLQAYYVAHLDDAKALLAVGEKPVDPALDPAELAAWTMLCNELMNLDEVLNK
jgi:mono/diheme cytochrome c family protein